MAAPAAAPVAGIYVAGAALLAGAAWLMTPSGQRASETLGEAIYEGGADAVQSIKDMFASDTESATTTTTNTTTRGCDGPHRGRLQVQGYAPRIDPHPIELSWPWVRNCVPPLRPEGLGALSGLLIQTQAINFESAGLRGPAFSKMSKHISKSPPLGFNSTQSRGWSISANKRAIPNKAKGVRMFSRNAPRVDMEIMVGRAFGDR